MIPFPRLYAIADSAFGDPVRLAESLFRGGARLVQVRNKKAGAGELLQQVERIFAFAPDDATVIVNDRVDVAAIAGTGVHLGQEDLPPAEARHILQSGRIVGFSTHNLEQALAADALPVDYIAVGPIFPTMTKDPADPVVGLERLADICKRVRKPVVAIGGIKLENAREVLNAGAASVAVIRDLLESPNVVFRVQNWTDRLKEDAS
jgi:thiamine-phosphate pyrophosphorylase